MKPFSVGAIPALNFGAGSFSSLLASLASNHEGHVVIVTGNHSFRGREQWRDLQKSVASWRRTSEYTVSNEPSPVFVDDAASDLRTDPPDLVVAVGGGSVIDAAKAIAAMVCADGSVTDYLEGVGDRMPSGVTVPVTAVPTTAGTGSEATKNAVISQVGPDGFKKSLRHENYIPKAVFIDPELATGCPLGVTRYAGLDAITQLLEAYVSSGAGNATAVLALEGLRLAGLCFPALASGEDSTDLRAGMALAAYYSGIALANAGLGIVHGMASPLGGAFPAPHGAVCATLLAESTTRVIEALGLETSLGKGGVAADQGLCKYARASVALTGEDQGSHAANCVYLVGTLRRWVDECEVPTLSEYGMSAADIKTIASQSGLKNTPAHLGVGDIEAILKARL